MHQDGQTIPVTVTVKARPHATVPHAHQPGSPLPFTGAPLDALTAWGVAITVVGAAVLTAVRRRRVAPRSYS